MLGQLCGQERVERQLASRTCPMEAAPSLKRALLPGPAFEPPGPGLSRLSRRTDLAKPSTAQRAVNTPSSTAIFEPVMPAMASSSPQRQSSTRPSHRDRDDDARGGLATTSLFASLSRLYSSETYSDLKIICGGETFHAHRAVVCSQSPFFHRALSGGFHVCSPPNSLRSFVFGSCRATLTLELDTRKPPAESSSCPRTIRRYFAASCSFSTRETTTTAPRHP